MTWLALHWTDVLFHLGLDLTGGASLKCAVGMCEHRRHQIAAWLSMGLFFSILTVYLIG
jgi:hypothetical protein